MKRRVLSMMLTLVMVFSLLPTSAFAVPVIALAAENYGLYVAGVQVTSENMNNITGDGISVIRNGLSGSVSYDPETQTLTLNNVNISAGNIITDPLTGESVICGIYTAHDLTVVLNGYSNISIHANDPTIKAAGIYISSASAQCKIIDGEFGMLDFDADGGKTNYGIDCTTDATANNTLILQSGQMNGTVSDSFQGVTLGSICVYYAEELKIDSKNIIIDKNAKPQIYGVLIFDSNAMVDGEFVEAAIYHTNDDIFSKLDSHSDGTIRINSAENSTDYSILTCFCDIRNFESATYAYNGQDIPDDGCLHAGMKINIKPWAYNSAGEHFRVWETDVVSLSNNNNVAENSFIVPNDNSNIFAKYGHSIEYRMLSNNRVIAECSGCDLSETITIAPPENLVYDGSPKPARLVLNPENPISNIRNCSISSYLEIIDDNNDIKSLNDPPINAGTYKAFCEVDSYTIDVTYTIEKVKMTAIPNLPIGLSLTNGQSLSVLTLPDGWEWVDDTQIPTHSAPKGAAYYYLDDIQNYDWSSVTGFDAQNSRIETDLDITLKIAPPDEPIQNEFTYNGQSYTYMQADDTAPYTVTGGMQTDANENGYTVTVSLKDKEHTVWSDTLDTEDKTFSFIIHQAMPEVSNAALKNPSLRITTATSPNTILLACEANQRGTIEADADQQLTQGEYALKWTFTPTDSKNYKAVTGTIPITVTEALGAPVVSWNTETGKATWSEVSGADAYSVQLYLNGIPHGMSTTVSDNELSIPFTEAGSYTFKVKARDAVYQDYGLASEASPELTVYQVSFQPNNGTSISSQYIPKSGKVTEPTAPAKSDYFFGGWYQEEACETPWNFAANTVQEDLTLYVKWAGAVASVTANGSTTEYGTVEDAIVAANEYTNATLKLLDNVLSSYWINGSMTIDFNGKMWTLPKTLSINASITLTDSSTEGSKGGFATSEYWIHINNSATVTVNSISALGKMYVLLGSTLDVSGVAADIINPSQITVDNGTLVLPSDMVVTSQLLDSYGKHENGYIKVGDNTYRLKKYAVTVSGGTASHTSQYAGLDVKVTADTPPLGKHFSTWTGEGVTFDNANMFTAVFVMPAQAVSVTADCEDHIWTYKALKHEPSLTFNQLIMAECDECLVDEWLCIEAPTGNLTYDGAAKAATLEKSAQNLESGLKDVSVSYEKKIGESSYETATNEEPINAGTYRASISVGSGENTKTASVEYTIAKADGPEAPTVTGSYAVSTKYIGRFVYTVDAIEGAEYQMNNLAPDGWTDNNVFDNLTPESMPTFYARIKETENVNASDRGHIDVTLSKLPNAAVPPLNYTVSGESGNRTVTIAPIDGAEYKFGYDDWSSTYIKSGLGDTTITVQIRYAATKTLNASEASSVEVNTAKQIQTISFESSTVSKVYGDIDFTMVATGAKEGSNVTYASSDNTVATVNNSGDVHILNAGRATITAKASETDNYNEAIAVYDLIIEKASITIKADDKSILIGEAIPEFTFTANGLVGTDTLSDVTYNDNGAANTAKGSFSITPSGCTITKSGGTSGDSTDNYSITYESGTLTVRVDTSAIDTALAAANAAKNGVTTDNRGTNQVASGTKFVSTGVMSALNTAIDTAKSKKDTVSDILEAQAAADELNSAVATFKAAIQTGTYVAPSATPTPGATPKPGTTVTPTPGASSTPGVTPTSGATPTPVPNVTQVPSTTETKVEPTVVMGDNEVKGWDEIQDGILKEFDKALKKAGLSEGESPKEPVSVTIDMGDSTTLPKDIISFLQGKNIDLTLSMDDGIKWTINGLSITGENFSDIDLGVTKNVKKIPIDIINQVTGENLSIQIELSHDGEFGFEAVLTIDLNKDNAGLYANLFYYNETIGKLEYVDSSLIDKDGNAALTFNHASTYSIVISEEELDETAINTDASDQSSPSSDNGKDTKDTASATQMTIEATEETSRNMLALWIALGAVIIVLIGGVVIYLLKKKEK